MQIGPRISKAIIIGFVTGLLASCGSDDNPCRVVLGTSNILGKTSSGLQYQLPFIVQVTNVEGTPASYVSVTFTVKSTEYRKGYYEMVDTIIPLDGQYDDKKWWAVTFYRQHRI